MLIKYFSGTRVKSFCSKNSDVICEACDSGYFSDISSKTNKRCSRCRHCGLKTVLQNCTSTTNTVCGECPFGNDFILKTIFGKLHLYKYSALLFYLFVKYSIPKHFLLCVLL